MKRFEIINECDSVAVALSPLCKGETVYGIILKDNIPQGHKFALKDIVKDADIIKYGCSIGHARTDIPQGSHVHTHNVITALSSGNEYKYNILSHLHSEKSSDIPDTLKIPEFSGYIRTDGKVGIRNEIWIIPTVGCVNDVAKAIQNMARRALTPDSGVDDIVAFSHPYGCSQLSTDQDNTRRILADLAMHPNAGGVLLLGLGCENSSVNTITELIPDYEQRPIMTLVCQDVEDEIEEGLEIVKKLIHNAAASERSLQDISKLTVGIKCGGSDGLSGITANPMVGRFSDTLISMGGSIIMSEVPEMFGAEQGLMDRAKDHDTFEKIVDMVNGFKAYYEENGLPVYENPSPGNKEGGITTLEDKSLGCTQKAGTSPVNDVLRYGEQAKTAGLSLLSGPGNDLVSSTALAASGAQLILFTTGRGTPFSAPVPTVKISTNSQLYKKKKAWIDFNAGSLIEEENSRDAIDKAFLDCVLEIASGKQVKAEAAGFRDMAIFKTGVTL